MWDCGFGNMALRRYDAVRWRRAERGDQIGLSGWRTAAQCHPNVAAWRGGGRRVARVSLARRLAGVRWVRLRRSDYKPGMAATTVVGCPDFRLPNFWAVLPNFGAVREIASIHACTMHPSTLRCKAAPRDSIHACTYSVVHPPMHSPIGLSVHPSIHPFIPP